MRNPLDNRLHSLFPTRFANPWESKKHREQNILLAVAVVRTQPRELLKATMVLRLFLLSMLTLGQGAWKEIYWICFKAKKSYRRNPMISEGVRGDMLEVGHSAILSKDQKSQQLLKKPIEKVPFHPERELLLASGLKAR